MSKTRKLLLTLDLIVALVSAVACFGCRAHPQPAKSGTDVYPVAAGFAVVELFTSEGCSSCPPADALLNRLADEARKNNSPIYCLAFHVDYFNHLGWVDKVSDAEYTRRQEWYGKIADNAEIYTPMMIVNGGAPFLGYDEAAARKQISHALHAASANPISLTIQEHPRESGLHVDYAAKGAEPGDLIHMAVIESGVGSKISRGENAGKFLVHDCVVRSLKSAPVGADGNGSLDFEPIKLAGGKLDSVIAFLQNQKSGNIAGAARTPLIGGQ